MTVGFGAYGKFPGLGDFLRLNLPADFITTWDGWLQAGMLEAQRYLGEDWDAAYLNAPIWRFTLPAGFAGAQPILGVLMASVDRVGRRYPLTLASPYRDADTVLTHFANVALFSHLEDIALAMLEDHATRDMLATELEPLTVSIARPEPFDLPYKGPIAPEAVLAAKALPHLQGQAVWSALSEDGYRLFGSTGLPLDVEMRALFAPSLSFDPDAVFL